MDGYRNGQEHLFDELHRLDLLLNARVAAVRRDPAFAGFNEFRGLFISEEEIDRLVRPPEPAADGALAPEIRDTATDAETAALQQAIAQAEAAIARRTAAALSAGVHLPLLRLARLFRLAPFDIDALLICLAPELDLKYEKLYGYLQNDVTRKRPTADLILNVLCRTMGEKLRARGRLSAGAPLIRQQLLVCPADGHPEATAWLARPLRLDRRILDTLLGTDAPDEELAQFIRPAPPAAALDQVLLPAALRDELVGACRPEAGEDGRPRVFLFHGPAGAGKKFTAAAICRAAGLDLLVADLAGMLAADAPLEPLARRLLREARLRSAAPYLAGGEILLGEADRAAHARRVWLDALAEFPGVAFIGSEQPWEEASFFRITFPVPDYAIRRRLWQAALAAEQRPAAALPDAGDVDLDALANRFNFTPGRIREAAAEARRLALLRGGDRAEITADDLGRACRSRSNTRLAALAHKITPLYRWEDIILPEDSLRHLHEICAQMTHRQQVFAEWGFDRKIALGKGLSVLFVGPSGTGKTMAAEIIAGELGLDLYKIDLAGMISKYIGETEKNLSRVFQEAEQSNAILFFDEADAVFGKRSEVKDSHDRYANIEINYLLQRMEEYEGVVILASNFRKNIDEAFTRRMRFIVEFPFPDEAYRYRIWRNVYPPGTPVGDDVDFTFLARQFKIPGGSIKNIALGSAFLAASDGRLVTMEHVIRATQREFQKLGRLCVKADFGPYIDLVAGEEAEA